jgi:hypothetical protein
MAQKPSPITPVERQTSARLKKLMEEVAWGLMVLFFTRMGLCRLGASLLESI